MRNNLLLIIAVLVLAHTALAQEFSNRQSQAVSPPAGQTVDKDRISLDIKGMDVVDVLKMLSTRSGMNIAIGKNVTGRVTLFLKDVNIWDAFEIVLSTNDLAYDKKGDIINVITQRDYELLYGERYKDKTEVRIVQPKYVKVADLSKALIQVKTNIGKIVVDEGSNTLVLIDTPDKLREMEGFIKNTDLPLQTRVFTLNYAQADKLAPKIQEAVTKGVGSIRIDERTNKIAITDYPDKLAAIEQIIAAFDEKTPQVLIDSQIIQLTPSDKLEVGVDWDYWIRKHFDIKAALPINSANTLFMGTAALTPAKAGQYKVIIDILRTIGDVKVLSSPRIMALNNQEAKIHVGVRDAYITSTTSQAGTGTSVVSQAVNFVDTGIQLNVVPIISRDGFVTMKIKPEISDSTRTSITSDGQKTDVPIVSTSEAETTVTVKDGVTIIIGGLKKDKREKTVKKIPLLGDIPGVGFLFRSTSDNVTTTELVILLTPHIMSGENTFSDFSEIMPKEGAVAKMIKGNIVTEKISSGRLTPLEYNLLVTDKIARIVRLGQPKGKKGEVVINFSLSREGYLIEEPRLVRASDDALTPFAVKAIKDAAPFPAFPLAMQKNEEHFSIAIDY